uniref:Uncharacterized protein n=1 Tax=Acrobeloides nanus TaxID=290746 RepID=A0A914D725_9BILA
MQIPSTPSSGYSSVSSYAPPRPTYPGPPQEYPQGHQGHGSYNYDHGQAPARYPLPAPPQASGQCTPSEMAVPSPHSVPPPPPQYPNSQHHMNILPLNHQNRSPQMMPQNIRIPNQNVHISPGENMAKSSGELTPRNEDLAYGAVEDNPFVNVFCSESSNPTDPLKINTNTYPNPHDIDPSLVQPGQGLAFIDVWRSSPVPMPRGADAVKEDLGPTRDQFQIPFKILE